MIIFGCESWNITVKEKSKEQTAIMKYLGTVTGATKKNWIRSRGIKEELIGVEPIQNFIKKRKIGWWGPQ